MKIEFIESFLAPDKMYDASNYDKDGLYYNVKENCIFCVYTTQAPEVINRTTMVAFICPYDAFMVIHKQQEFERSNKENEQFKERLEMNIRDSTAKLVSKPDPTVSENFALKMLSIAMKNDKYSDV